MHLEASSVFSSKHFQYSSRAPQQACLSFIDGAAIPSGFKLSTKICDINKGLIIPEKASQRKRYCRSLRPPLFKTLPPDFNDATTTNQFYRNVIIRALAGEAYLLLHVIAPLLRKPLLDSWLPHGLSLKPVRVFSRDYFPIGKTRVALPILQGCCSNQSAVQINAGGQNHQAGQGALLHLAEEKPEARGESATSRVHSLSGAPHPAPPASPPLRPPRTRFPSAPTGGKNHAVQQPGKKGVGPSWSRTVASPAWASHVDPTTPRKQFT